MNLQEEIEKIKEEGYNEANAEARLCQDIILKAISESSLRRNVTIKGGVVMRNLSGRWSKSSYEFKGTNYNGKSKVIITIYGKKYKV